MCMHVLSMSVHCFVLLLEVFRVRFARVSCPRLRFGECSLYRYISALALEYKPDKFAVSFCRRRHGVIGRLPTTQLAHH